MHFWSKLKEIPVLLENNGSLDIQVLAEQNLELKKA
jgi:hypothetical protein